MPGRLAGFLVIASLVSAAFLSGANAADVALEKTQWALVSMAGTPIVSRFIPVKPSLELLPPDSACGKVTSTDVHPARENPAVNARLHCARARLYDGCNYISASYTLQGEALTFQRSVSTLMGCTPAAQVDLERAIAKVRRWSVRGDVLDLWDEQGLPVAEFQPKPATPAVREITLEHTGWVLATVAGKSVRVPGPGKPSLGLYPAGALERGLCGEPLPASSNDRDADPGTPSAIACAVVTNGCDIVYAPYETQDQALQLRTSHFRRSSPNCTPPWYQPLFEATLWKIRGWTIRGDHLELIDENGSILAEFRLWTAADGIKVEGPKKSPLRMIVIKGLELKPVPKEGP